MQYLNLGCGNRFCNGPEWINIDFNSVYDNVKSINILKGLPFADESVDAVFSSCMLEHLTKDQAQKHLSECFRVLRQGGVCRIVVPDLENVCREYLRMLELVRNDEAYRAKYDYILIELIDQMTRMYSGGEMLKYWQSPDKDEEYIWERTGYPEDLKGKLPLRIILKGKIGYVTAKVFGRLPFYQKYQLGKFMLSGETHKWMYDEYGLTQLLKSAGFQNVVRASAGDSMISGWNQYELELDGGKEYKPHSLYVEGVKIS